MMRVAAALAALFVLLFQSGVDVAALALLGQVVLAMLALGVLGDLLGILVWLRGRTGVSAAEERSAEDRTIAPTIIVDGSNVMHWGGDPSQMVLTRVIAAIVAQGYRPHIYFDANAGYKLFDKFMSEAAMAQISGVLPTQVTVVPGGTPADPVLLEHAVSARVRVVTNDQFRDWKSQFPQIEKRGFLVEGRWQQGTPILNL